MSDKPGPNEIDVIEAMATSIFETSIAYKDAYRVKTPHFAWADLSNAAQEYYRDLARAAYRSITTLQPAKR